MNCYYTIWLAISKKSHIADVCRLLAEIKKENKKIEKRKMKITSVACAILDNF
ncbi:MAG: hypothetical protein ACM3VV_04450 [Deltaproteobacteria bacterium]